MKKRIIALLLGAALMIGDCAPAFAAADVDIEDAAKDIVEGSANETADDLIDAQKRCEESI